MATSQVANLLANRELCSGDIITFVLTRQYPTTSLLSGIDYSKATATFTYDAGVLHYNNKNDFNNASSVYDDGAGLITIQYNDLSAGKPSPYNQQNIFLNFQAEPGLTAGGKYKVPVFKIRCRNTMTGDYQEVGSSTLSDQAIELGHDPNQKTTKTLVDLSDQYVTYKIDFQNEGAGQVNTIEIEDKLDTLFSFNDPPIPVSCPKCTLSLQPPVVVSRDKRTYKFTLNGHLPLRGMREKGYGISFPDKDTKGSFTVKYKLRNGLMSWRSSAILNQAKIRFDCNPLYDTDVSASVIPCSDTINVMADLAYNVPDTAGANTVANGLSALLGGYGINNSNGKFRWYPATEMVNHEAIAPIFLHDAVGAYTLVASKCSNPSTMTPSANNIVYIHIKIASPLKINVDKCISPGNLVATVSGYKGSNPGTDLKWHTCATAASISEPVDNKKSVYFFGVTDLSTGNYTEIFYKLNNRVICPLPDNWLSANAKMLTLVFGAILAGAALLFLQRSKKQ